MAVEKKEAATDAAPKYTLTAEKKELIKGYYASKKNGYITSGQPSVAQVEAVKEYQAATGKNSKETQAAVS